MTLAAITMTTPEAASPVQMYRATYSPDDNKLRLYAVSRLDPETYKKVHDAGFRWAPKQALFVAPAWTPGREDVLLSLAGEIEDEDSTLAERQEARAERFTKDKVNLRINLAANWRYSDVLLAFSQLTKPIDHLYRELQFALREVVGTRTLDELLEDKQVIDDVVSEQVKSRMLPFGMEIASLGVKDIVLPGDMKNILAQLVEAEKSAQANVIRRREETAATRSLLNTAKVMENNPVALRLKELETLERVAERIDNISVFGGLDQVLHGLVNIKG